MMIHHCPLSKPNALCPNQNLKTCPELGKPGKCIEYNSETHAFKRKTHELLPIQPQ